MILSYLLACRYFQTKSCVAPKSILEYPVYSLYWTHSFINLLIDQRGASLRASFCTMAPQISGPHLWLLSIEKRKCLYKQKALWSSQNDCKKPGRRKKTEQVLTDSDASLPLCLWLVGQTEISSKTHSLLLWNGSLFKQTHHPAHSTLGNS